MTKRKREGSELDNDVDKVIDPKVDINEAFLKFLKKLGQTSEEGNQQTKQVLNQNNQEAVKTNDGIEYVYKEGKKLIDFQRSDISALQNYLERVEKKSKNQKPVETSEEQKSSQENSSNSNNILLDISNKDISYENIIKLAYDPNHRISNDRTIQDILVEQYKIFNTTFFRLLGDYDKDYLKAIYQSFKINDCDIEKLPIDYKQALENLQKFIMPEGYRSVETNLFSILFHDFQAVCKLEIYFSNQPEQESMIIVVGQVTEV